MGLTLENMEAESVKHLHKNLNSTISIPDETPQPTNEVPGTQTPGTQTPGTQTPGTPTLKVMKHLDLLEAFKELGTVSEALDDLIASMCDIPQDPSQKENIGGLSLVQTLTGGPVIIRESIKQMHEKIEYIRTLLF
ncbi:MAG: hypothetical protein PVG39_00895 [Desulfobacteraceae bacterium]|jgi:hypothetical protein